MLQILKPREKLLVKYLTVPVQFNFSPNPTNRKAFYASIGMSAGDLWNAKNKKAFPFEESF